MTEPRYDVETLRIERSTRLQASMRGHGLDVCLLFHEPNEVGGAGDVVAVDRLSVPANWRSPWKPSRG